MSDQIRRAIKTSPITRYQIWQETGIDQATLSKFVHRKGGLSIDALDRLADCLGLDLAIPKTPPKRKRKGGDDV